MSFRLGVKDSELQSLLQGMVRAGRNMSAVNNSIALELVAETEHAFKHQGVPTKWQTLAAATIKSRSKRKTWPGKILQVSGGLAASVQPGSNESEARLHVGKVYAGIHQFGGKAGRGKNIKIPARPFAPFVATSNVFREYRLTDAAHRAIMRLMVRHFTR